MLNAARVIQFIESGQNAVTFDSVSVVKSSPNMPKTFALSFVLCIGWNNWGVYCIHSL